MLFQKGEELYHLTDWDPNAKNGRNILVLPCRYCYPVARMRHIIRVPLPRWKNTEQGYKNGGIICMVDKNLFRDFDEATRKGFYLKLQGKHDIWKQ